MNGLTTSTSSGQNAAMNPRTASTGNTDNAAADRQPGKVRVAVFFWERKKKQRALKSYRIVPVEQGAPVIWALGSFGRFCADMLRFIVDPEADLRFKMRGAEVFWFTPVDKPAVLHVYRDVR
jgi:hypothetical protein